MKTLFIFLTLLSLRMLREYRHPANVGAESQECRVSRGKGALKSREGCLSLRDFMIGWYETPGKVFQPMYSSSLTSKEAQALASITQSALLKDDHSLSRFDYKIVKDSLGLSLREKKRVEELMYTFRLDREGRKDAGALELFYVALYGRLYPRIGSEDLVVSGSGNSHKVLLAPNRLKAMLYELHEREEKQKIFERFHTKEGE